MPSAIEAIHALKDRLSREQGLPLRAVSVTPVREEELRLLEAALGSLLPKAYLQFITQHGLFAATDSSGHERARMLSPAEVLEQHAGYQEFLEEDSFGEEEDEREAALRELEVRRRLIPFQYIADSFVHDFYSFDTGWRRDEGALILKACHDDYDLAPWLLDDAPDTSGCTFDFDEHLNQVLRELL
ncbi:SMI1/KNR4 family protein [Corallococcus interemptor]|uniref:SMI1/KNR4 family protein n=1 Tax=Corallococcus TaxID=83461 RepID=UPI001CBC7A74|nr:SMI1/KNR4 family protein [Corallococcus sp. AS-1-12]MBZ4334101.1 SMI1/KNR4 family protein [Corallococcus sp. AS-1-12]